jgi:hypothetical protein
MGSKEMLHPNGNIVRNWELSTYTRIDEGSTPDGIKNIESRSNVTKVDKFHIHSNTYCARRIRVHFYAYCDANQGKVSKLKLRLKIDTVWQEQHTYENISLGWRYFDTTNQHIRPSASLKIEAIAETPNAGYVMVALDSLYIETFEHDTPSDLISSRDPTTNMYPTAQLSWDPGTDRANSYEIWHSNIDLDWEKLGETTNLYFDVTPSWGEITWKYKVRGKSCSVYTPFSDECNIIAERPPRSPIIESIEVTKHAECPNGGHCSFDIDYSVFLGAYKVEVWDREKTAEFNCNLFSMSTYGYKGKDEPPDGNLTYDRYCLDDDIVCYLCIALKAVNPYGHAWSSVADNGCSCYGPE